MLLIRFQLQKLKTKENMEGIKMKTKHPAIDGKIKGIAVFLLFFGIFLLLLSLFNFDFTYILFIIK